MPWSGCLTPSMATKQPWQLIILNLSSTRSQILLENGCFMSTSCCFQICQGKSATAVSLCSLFRHVSGKAGATWKPLIPKMRIWRTKLSHNIKQNIGNTWNVNGMRLSASVSVRSPCRHKCPSQWRHPYSPDIVDTRPASWWSLQKEWPWTSCLGMSRCLHPKFCSKVSLLAVDVYSHSGRPGVKQLYI